MANWMGKGKCSLTLNAKTVVCNTNVETFGNPREDKTLISTIKMKIYLTVKLSESE